MDKPLRVLLACPPSGNPYISELHRHINSQEGVSCVLSHEELLESFELQYDVIHIQWPEALFGWQSVITYKKIELLVGRLAHCKEVGIKIVVTIHNDKPHGVTEDIYLKLYECVYEKADAFVHFGNRSVQAIKSRNDALHDAYHIVIPHGNYSYFNEVKIDWAPSFAGKMRLRVLCFGAIRNLAEIGVCCQVADFLSEIDGELVVAGNINSRNKMTLDYYKMRIPLCRRGNVRRIKGRIPDEFVAGLVASCNAILIPRIDSLNSGNVALGFTFGKVVLGPNIGVIGEELAKLGNPTFEPLSNDGLRKAVQDLLELVNSPLGQKNKTYAETEMCWRSVAESHKKVYLSLWGR